MKIEVTGYSKTINKNKVLDNISVRFTSGKVYGIRGENGSGKTMLMKAICGLIFADSGNISIDGRIIGRDISFPESVGILIENSGFIGSYSAYDNLKSISLIKSCAGDNEIYEALEAVGLDSHSKKKYRQFSLGMKQKLGIAAAIFEKPDLIILDEPFNALDEKSRTRIKNIINERSEAGALVIVSSHDKELLDDVCDEIINIQEGKLIEAHNSKTQRNMET